MIKEKSQDAIQVDQKITERKFEVPKNNQNNQLLSLAMPILALLVSVRSLKSYSSLELLKENVIKLMNHFESQSKQLGYTHRIILAARYCLCAALDETVLGTPWGRESSWAERSLLATLHHETWGGERFYIVLEKMGDEGAVNLDLLELLYVILSIGFEGMYYNNEGKREEIRQHLYEKIISLKPQIQKTLFLDEINTIERKLPKRRAWKIWVTFVFSLLLILATGYIYQSQLNIAVNRVILEVAVFKMKLPLPYYTSKP